MSKILLMDDEKCILSTVSQLLEILGHKVVCASDGEEAIRLYAEEKQAGRPFDIVMMDLTVREGMGGEQATQRIIKSDPEAKIYLTSGYAGELTDEDVRKIGAAGIIPKPFTAELLMESIPGGILPAK